MGWDILVSLLVFIKGMGMRQEENESGEYEISRDGSTSYRIVNICKKQKRRQAVNQCSN